MPPFILGPEFNFFVNWHGHCCNDTCADNYEPGCGDSIYDDYGALKHADIVTCNYGGLYGQLGKDSGYCNPYTPPPPPTDTNFSNPSYCY